MNDATKIVTMNNITLLNVKCLKCNNDFCVPDDESLRGNCTNERLRVRKRDKKVRTDASIETLKEKQKFARTVTDDG